MKQEQVERMNTWSKKRIYLIVFASFKLKQNDKKLFHYKSYEEMENKRIKHMGQENSFVFSTVQIIPNPAIK